MDENTVQEIQALAVAGVEIRRAGEDDAPFVVTPPGYTVSSLEALERREQPFRAKGTTGLRTVESFVRFVKKHGDDTASLYAHDGDKPHFTAIFNDHSEEGPGHRDHRATYACPLSKEWEIWIGKNGKSMSQVEFAKFIEDNLPDVVEPPAADMLVVSRTLEAKKSVEFRSGQRLSNGEQELVYNEQVEATSGKGSLQVPEEFSIGIPVFNGGEAYKVTARLRYRINDGKLALWYELLREHKVLEDAFKTVCAEIESGTGLVAFIAASV